MAMTEFIEVGTTKPLRGASSTSNLGRVSVKIIPTSQMPIRIAGVDDDRSNTMSARQAQELAKLLWAAAKAAQSVKHSYEVAGDAVTRAHANRDRIVQHAIETALKGLL